MLELKFWSLDGSLALLNLTTPPILGELLNPQ